MNKIRRGVIVPVAAALCSLLLAGTAAAHDPEFTQDFNRERCTFTTSGTNPYFPLWPGYSLLLEGEEEDEGETVEIAARITVLTETEMVDGVLTRVVEERESEDGELVEVSRNFMALCRETGSIWYFGEDVDDYEDGEIVGHGGAWRTGVNGAQPGIIMMGSPVVGSRYHQELAPGVAEDLGEVTAINGAADVEAGSFDHVITIVDTSALAPGEPGDTKQYAYGVGNIVDEDLELTEITAPPCQPDAFSHCLNNGRFRVTVEYEDQLGGFGPGHAILPSDDSGEFWFFNANNSELLVKVLDACGVPGFNTYWVFAAGLTNVEVTLTVTDTQTGAEKVYERPLNQNFRPIVDTQAFATCP